VDPESDQEALVTGPAAMLPRLGDALPMILQRFEVQPLLGVVLLDASPLRAIEQASGRSATDAVMSRLGAMVLAVCAEDLDGEEIVVSGETGRYEIALLLFRRTREGGLVRHQLPRLARSLEDALAREGRRLTYPYGRQQPLFGVGFAAMGRNPFLACASQVRAVMEEARSDAELQRRVAARQRRHVFQGVVLANEVYSVYEPIVDVASKTVFGYEALARGPAGTPFESPLCLFESAEEQGLVFELDCLCRQSGLDGAVGLPSSTRLFLNVRPTTIHDPSFRPDALIRTLERTKLRPSDVVLEISEQESIENFDAFREIRDEYRQLGFQFALDDTGSGYASLQAVIELEPDFIKVDRALITGVDNNPSKRALLEALQAVASSTGARIVGEGLDTLEELAVLEELGIPFGQGWLFGKPTPLRASD
jgi:EAL domain-containing protein (putative c-di-GMP-specific phosphodiesterase class I)